MAVSLSEIAQQSRASQAEKKMQRQLNALNQIIKTAQEKIDAINIEESLMNSALKGQDYCLFTIVTQTEPFRIEGTKYSATVGEDSTSETVNAAVRNAFGEKLEGLRQVVGTEPNVAWVHSRDGYYKGTKERSILVYWGKDSVPQVPTLIRDGVYQHNL